MEKVKNTIEQHVSAPIAAEGVNVTKYKDLVEIRQISIQYSDHVENVAAEVWTKAIQKALDTEKVVYIPNIGHTIYLDAPLVLRSGYRIVADQDQMIGQVPDTNTCMVRNENIINGKDRAVMLDRPDCDISVEGGVWTTFTTQMGIPNGNFRGHADKEQSMQGAFGFMLFSNVERLQIRNITIQDGMSYGFQISNCRDFLVEDICFVRHHKDGVHVNGPVQYGIIRNLRGKDMGDDMVALNAWDWCTSAVTFGTIEDVLVQNVKSNNNEFRLLPGRKMFEDGSFVDCDLRRVVLENISGVYTYKLYCQPNIANAIRGIHDTSGAVGNIKDVYFKNITFDAAQEAGFNELPVGGLFEVCADCDGLYLEDITVEEPFSSFQEKQAALFKAGPLSATWKNDSDDPAKWGEVFDPDAICTVDNIHMKNIRFRDGKGGYEAIDDTGLLTRETHMTINPDYPNTTPKGGTGYGTIRRITVEK